jgi:hypothetical protein
MSDQCSVEADHLHNLPSLMCEPQYEVLSYYYNVERVEFIAKAEHIEQFGPEWVQLEAILKELAV